MDFLARLAVCVVCLCASSATVCAEDAKAPAAATAASGTLGTVERLDPRIDEYVPKDATIEKLAEGLDWSEGPVWVKDGSYLLFSDIPRNVVLRWSADKGLSEFLKPSGFTGKEAPAGIKEPGSNGLA